MLSASQISLFRECKFKYKCRYIKKIETEKSEALYFGSLFHESIPKYNAKTVEEIKETDRNLYLMLKELYNSNYKDYKIQEFERKEKQVLDGVPLTTIVDAFGEDFILEFKTAGKPWDKQKFEDEIQSVIYMKSEERRTGKLKNFVYVVVMKPTDSKKSYVTFHEVPFNEQKWQEIKKTYKEMKNEFDYLPNAYKNKKNNCHWCEYINYCPAKF